MGYPPVETSTLGTEEEDSDVFSSLSDDEDLKKPRWDGGLTEVHRKIADLRNLMNEECHSEGGDEEEEDKKLLSKLSSTLAQLRSQRQHYLREVVENKKIEQDLRDRTRQKQILKALYSSDNEIKRIMRKRKQEHVQIQNLKNELEAERIMNRVCNQKLADQQRWKKNVIKILCKDIKEFDTMLLRLQDSLSKI